jgi:hypothetical protein
MPTIKKTAQRYAVRDRDVSLSLFVGNGQFGRTDVLLDGESILDRVTGDINNLVLGPGIDLQGRTLAINTLAVDVNTDTNRLGITYELKGGKRAIEFESKDVVPSEFGSILFVTTVRFV